MEKIKIGYIPALVWGETSDKVLLCVHGQGGSKDEAAVVADEALPLGWQVLAFDLPEHGERRDGIPLEPWHVEPELRAVMAYARARWPLVGLYANSIGAWFSMLAWPEEALERCLFVSPVVDMPALIRTMMGWAGVDEERLLREQTIPTQFGQTLSWTYYQWTIDHPVTTWTAPTCILYGGRDAMIARADVEAFAARFHGKLTVMEDGEHWFHTDEQMRVLRRWLRRELTAGQPTEADG